MLRYYQPDPNKLAMIAEEHGRARGRDRGGAGRAPHRLSVSGAIRRSAAKPIISRRNVETEPFSSTSRRAILSLVNPVAILEFRMCLDNPTLVQHGRSDHRLGQVTRLRQTSGGRFGGRLIHRWYSTSGAQPHVARCVPWQGWVHPGGPKRYLSWLSLLPRRLNPVFAGRRSRADWQAMQVRTPGSTRRRASGIVSPHSRQMGSASPVGMLARALRTPSMTVSSI